MNEENKTMRKRSGEKDSDDLLVGILYDLVRDHVQPSVMEKVIRDNVSIRGETQQFTNGWLASYAEDLANRIRGESQ